MVEARCPMGTGPFAILGEPDSSGRRSSPGVAHHNSMEAPEGRAPIMVVDCRSRTDRGLSLLSESLASGAT